MRRLLHGLEGVINYLDDILIFSSNWEAHLETLGKVLSRLERANLTARPTKCMLGFRSLEFMGYQLGNGSLKPETGKVSTILDIEVPRTKTQVRAIMGLINYYRRFVPNFAAITAPLSDLTKKGYGQIHVNGHWSLFRPYYPAIPFLDCLILTGSSL
ncbi:Retrovirus-related Pol polyprotein [Biomphalaria glabrata]|nr:Retrovirus-related Pol polyprotein from transposon 297 [Biomphalaria glabrata]